MRTNLLAPGHSPAEQVVFGVRSQSALQLLKLERTVQQHLNDDATHAFIHKEMNVFKHARDTRHKQTVKASKHGHTTPHHTKRKHAQTDIQ